MNNNLIITIGREYGTGGREIGQKLALRLGISFYEIEGKTPQAALEKMDKQRSTYYNYYTGKVWGKCDHYDMCINAGRLGVEHSVDIILEYVNRLKK